VLSSLRWNHVFGRNVFSNVTLNYTRYRLFVEANSASSQTLNTEDITQTRTNFYSRSGIEDISAKMDFDFYPSPSHSIKFGAHLVNHRFTPGISTFRESSLNDQTDTTLASYTVRAWEGSLYAEDDWEITGRWKVNAGIHLAGFYVNNTFYRSVQPRIATRYLLGNGYAAKASYASMQQFIHLLTNSNAGLPTDLWVPATDNIRPQQSRQVALGIARSFADNAFELSIEAYYKSMSGLIEYKEGTNFLTYSDNWEESVEVDGKGQARGVEILLQRKTGRLTGWAGYTLSKTDRQFENINFGRTFPFKYDRRHDLSLVTTYKASKKVTLSGSWVYGTGNAVTLASTQYHLDRASPGNYFNRTIHVYNGRNSFRMRSYHRLDINLSFSKQKKWGERTWNFGAYNLYSRRNPYLYFIGGNPYLRRQVKQVSLFPIIPYVNYNFKF
jgi:outer membrane receptor for ferrienterochelin and colicin